MRELRKAGGVGCLTLWGMGHGGAKDRTPNLPSYWPERLKASWATAISHFRIALPGIEQRRLVHLA